MEGRALNPLAVIVRYAAVLCAAAVLPAGCGSPPPFFKGEPRAVTSGAQPRAGHSWMSPQARGEDLLYVSTGLSDGATWVYSYPKGDLVGGLSAEGTSQGLCSDSSGNVFITNQYAIYEYPHGSANASAVLTNPFGATFGCSVDPGTGDLAAIATSGVVIFHPQARHGWKLGQLFTFSYSKLMACGYDATGDLYLGGVLKSNLSLIVLEKGSSKFKKVLVNKRFFAQSIQWDGKYLAVLDTTSNIRRFQFHGTTGRQVGITRLIVTAPISQSWIYNGIVSATTYLSDQFVVGFWPYPEGGNPQKTVAQEKAYGVTVSIAAPIR